MTARDSPATRSKEVEPVVEKQTGWVRNSSLKPSGHVGADVGGSVSRSVGENVGADVSGENVGADVNGENVGRWVGLGVGLNVGLPVGDGVGAEVTGLTVGVADGENPHSSTAPHGDTPFHERLMDPRDWELTLRMTTKVPSETRGTEREVLVAPTTSSPVVVNCMPS